MPEKDLEITITIKQNSGGLSAEETEVLESLASAWNKFMEFKDVIKTDDINEFRAGIHQCQDVLARRALHRMFPYFWK